MYCCFFFKQKTAYEVRISDWSSDVSSSDLRCWRPAGGQVYRSAAQGGRLAIATQIPDRRATTHGGIASAGHTLEGRTRRYREGEAARAFAIVTRGIAACL